MSHISDYTEEAINRRLGRGCRVYSYDTTVLNCGLTCVQYKTNFTPGGFLVASLNPYFFLVSGTTAAIFSLIQNKYYFDSDSGELIGASENEAAKKANDKGVECCKTNNFEKAGSWFNRAYQLCSTSDSEEATYKNNRDAAYIAAEGQTLYNNREYAQASTKFKEAYDKSNNRELYSLFSIQKEKSAELANESAQDSFRRGIELCKQDNFSHASVLFEEASQNCMKGYMYEEYYQKCIEAASIASEAEDFLKNESFTDAYGKYQQACRIINTGDMYNILQCKIEQTNEMITKNTAALLAYEKAVTLSTEGRFSEAVSHFYTAYQTCTSKYAFKQHYRKCGEAVKIVLEAQKLVKYNKFVDACNKYQEACNKTNDTELLNKIQQEMKQTNKIIRKNKAAYSAYEKAVELTILSRFSEAVSHFDEAYRTCSNGYEYKIHFGKCSEVAKIASDADKFFQKEDFIHASRSYEEAYNRTDNKDMCNIFKEKMNLANELNTAKSAKNAYETGVLFCERNRFLEAVASFEKAYLVCSQSNQYKNDYKSCVDVCKLVLQADALLADGEFLETKKVLDNALKKSTVNLVQKVIVAKINAVNDIIDRNKKAEIAYNNAITCCEYSNFSTARTFFLEAYQTCANAIDKEKLYKACMDISKTAVKAENLLSNGKNIEAVTQFKIVLEKVENLETVKIHNIFLKKLDTVQALLKFQEGIRLWEEGWKAETNDNAEYADSNFNKAKQIFEEICLLYVENEQYKTWLNTVNNKIEGNKLFNEGVELQVQANNLKQRHEFQKAKEKYQESEKKFCEGLYISNDVRFENCIKFVRDALSEIELVLQNINKHDTYICFDNLNNKIIDNEHDSEEELIIKHTSQTNFIID